MIIFLYGPDSYRRQQKIQELTAAYRQKHPNFDFQSFDLAENPENYSALEDFLNQQSLFDNFKMALVKGIGEAEPKKIKPILKNQLAKENSALLISEDKKPTKDFDFLREKPALSQEFEGLTGEKLNFFIKKEAAKRNLNFSTEALNYLVRGQHDNWSLINELDKIALADFPQPIDKIHLESLISFSNQEKIFDLAGILAGHYPWPKKLSALERLFLQKESVNYIFNCLSYQAYGSLLLRLADYDWQVKSGGLDYEEVLLDLALTNN